MGLDLEDPFCATLGFVSCVGMVCLTRCGFCGVVIIQNSDGWGGVGSLGRGGFSGVEVLVRDVDVGWLVVGVGRVLGCCCLCSGRWLEVPC